MKTIGDKVDKVLWDKQEDYYNKVSYHAPFISFFNMQMIRCLNFVFVFVLWSLSLYISLKKCVLYIHCWALTQTLIALGFLFVSSGRQVIEKKLAARGDPVEEQEKSETWKVAILMYGIAMPFVFTANVLYFVLVKDDLEK